MPIEQAISSGTSAAHTCVARVHPRREASARDERRLQGFRSGARAPLGDIPIRLLGSVTAQNDQPRTWTVQLASPRWALAEVDTSYLRT